MVVYFDSSVILGVILNQPKSIKWENWDLALSNEISRVECLRAIYRFRLEGKLNDDQTSKAVNRFESFWERIWKIPISRNILNRSAQLFSFHIKTLDSIHLSSAFFWEEHKQKPVEFLTHDKKLGSAVQAMGMKVRGF